MTSKTITTPYYSAQYLLREFAKGLGTKSLAGKKIDDACKNAEINPYLLDSLKKVLIHEPLSKYVNIYFADHILKQFNKITDSYFQLIKTVPLDGVNAEISRQFIDQFFMTFAIAEICSDTLNGMKLSTRYIARSDRPLISIVLEKLDDSTEWQQFVINSSDYQKDRLRIWSLEANAELPDLTSIASLGEQWQRGNSWGTIKARLITARLWGYFFHRSGYTDIAMLVEKSPEECLVALVENLFKLLHKGTIKYQATTPLAMNLFELLSLRTPKKVDAQNQCLALLKELKKQQVQLDVNHETTYYYHWMRARYHLHSGKLTEAIEDYKLAFEQVIYRQGENAEKIIIEAIVVACRVPKPAKSFINRLRRMAVVMKIDFMPPNLNNDAFKVKPQDIDNWEISAFSQYFDAFFTRESFFIGSIYPENLHSNCGIWMVDEASHELNIKKPNKLLSVGMNGGLIKKMPQLVYFAMQDDNKAVSALISAGADINKLSSSSESAILMAIQSMQVNLTPLNSMSDEAFYLLSQKPHRKSVLDALTDKRKLSALGCAVQTGRPDIVQKVLEMGASVDGRHDIIGETPLYTAIGLIAHHTRPQVNSVHWERMKYSEVSLQSIRAHAAGLFPHDIQHLKRVMLEQDSNPLFRNTTEACKEYERKNITKYSTAEDFRKIAKILIQHSADPNAKHDTAMLGYTPLMLAAELDEVELIEAMLDSKHHQVNFADTCVDVSLRLHSLTWAVSPIQSFLESKSAVTHYFLDNSMAGNFLGWL
ncbi:ankyrin repeat domain-containing protein, partial [Psychromonas antarctica]|uniref:ankyrin repeat domain-containing protein n=1 Tax=Psychromonas antarctica TaxID=67573 RepID=UPI001EE8644C